MESCVDFANKYLGTTAYTNVVTADGYEVENLLDKRPNDTISQHSRFAAAKNGESRSDHGFMADYFTKPPVDVVIQFPCFVDIDCILINRKSGGKRIAEFIVSTANAKMKTAKGNGINNNKRNLEDQSELGQNGCYETDGFPHSYEPDLAVSDIRKENVSLLHMVGKFSAKNSGCDEVIFRNAKNYRGKGNEFVAHGRQTFLLFSLQYLYAVSHLIIRVFRTEASTAVAVKNIEIWGKPARRNGISVNKHVFFLAKEFENKVLSQKREEEKISNQKEQDRNKINDKIKGNHEHHSHPSGSETHNITEHLHIPDEFLDPITFEIMVLPVLLPSGHTIDSNTLERCNQEDERNGRVAVDPFTGIPLNCDNKAVPNTALKYRLDSFMLQNKSKMNDAVLGQTTGVNLTKVDMIGRVKNVKWRANFDTGSEALPKRARLSNLGWFEKFNTISNIGSFPKKLNDDNCKSLEYFTTKEGTTKNVEHSAKAKLNDSNAKKPAVKKFSSSKKGFEPKTEDLTTAIKSSHEQLLKDSLETALQKVIIPSRSTDATIRTGKGKEHWTCSICDVSGNEVHFFKISCGHLICRNCVTENSTGKKCGTCQRVFLNNEVTRVHFSKYFHS